MLDAAIYFTRRLVGRSRQTSGTLLSALLLCTTAAARAQQPVWAGYGGNAQHTALSANAAQALQTIHWQTSIDLTNPTGTIYIHYGSPMITAKNTVIATVRTTGSNTFEIEAFGGYSGEVKWTLPTDYTTPPSGWVPSCGATLSPSNSVYVPAAGGTLLQVSNVDSTRPYTKRLAFYGLKQYNAATSTYNSNVYVDTPVTCDKNGNLYFGFQVAGTNPAGLQGGLARIGANGVGTWVSAAAASGDSTMTKVANNCTPAISNDGSLVYVAVNNSVGSFGGGHLLALNSTTLQTVAVVTPADPTTGYGAIVTDDATASPTVGPDDDVYYGVLEDPFPSNGDRGWLLHYDKLLATVKTPGAFGWDDSASVVPATAVPSYTGTSSYLLLTKYNNYADGLGGDGHNRVAILDPEATMTWPPPSSTGTYSYSGTPILVMNEVITVLGVTPDAANASVPGAVREWCINSAAIDPQTKAAVINSEDGSLYRWDFTSNSLSQKVVLTSGVSEAYTPTLIGPDGAAYAVNDSILFSVGASAPDVSKAVSVSRYTLRGGNSRAMRIQTVKLTNISGCLLTGPIYLVLDNLSHNATLTNQSGVTTNAAPLGNPYVTVQTGNMSAGASVTLTLTFQEAPLSSTINYTTRVLSGPGTP
jgi:hypothetical protein